MLQLFSSGIFIVISSEKKSFFLKPQKFTIQSGPDVVFCFNPRNLQHFVEQWTFSLKLTWVCLARAFN